MVRPRTLRLGEGARCNVLVKNLRLSREVTERILNPLPRQRVTDLIVTRRAIITRGRSSYEAIFSQAPPSPTSNSMLRGGLPSSTPRDTPTASTRQSYKRTAPKRRRLTLKPSEKSTRRFSTPGILSRTSLEFVPRALRSMTTTRPSPRTGPRLMRPQSKSPTTGFSEGRSGDGMDSINEFSRGGGTKTHLSRTDGRP